MNFQKFKEQLSEGAFDEVLKTLYGSCEQTISRQRQRYVSEMNRIFGDGSCYVLKIRPVCGIEITEERYEKI